MTADPLPKNITAVDQEAETEPLHTNEKTDQEVDLEETRITIKTPFSFLFFQLWAEHFLHSLSLSLFLLAGLILTSTT